MLIRSLIGILLALGIPALATLRMGFTDATAMVALALVPWLTVAWVHFVERRPMASIGVVYPTWRIAVICLVGVAVNLAITALVTRICTAFGLAETESDLMRSLLHGPGWILVVLVTNGAFLTELSFRGYTIERLGELLGGRRWLGAVIQIGVTTAIFAVGRGRAHAFVWLVDDIVFSIFYLKTRNIVVCVAAHAVPNLVASSLVASGLAN